MATNLSQSQRQGKAPATSGVPNGVGAHTSEQGRHPFPVGDIVGAPIRARPYIPPHRLAQTTRDRDAVYNRLRAGSRWIDESEIREPFLSRFGNWARESDLFQWFIALGGVLVIATLIAAFASALLPTQ